MKKLLIIMCTVKLFSLSEEVTPTQTLRINLFHNAIDLSLEYAESMGYFREEGILLEKIYTDKGSTAAEALVSGSLDVGCISSWVFLLQLKENPQLKLFSTYATTYLQDILVSWESGILTPEDLKGKIFAINRGTQLEFALENLLAHSSIHPEEMILIDATGAELETLFKSKEIHSSLAIEPWATLILESNTARRVRTEKIFRVNLSYIATEEYIKENREILISFLNAVHRANRDLAHPDEKTILKLQTLTGLSRDNVITILKEVNYELTLDNLLLITMKSQLSWMKKRELVDKDSLNNLLIYLEPSLLKKVHPQGVTLP